jgi:ubiquinone biosynthesis protein COQ9
MAMPQMSHAAARMAGAAPTGYGGYTATDFNHYTKRMTLSAVYASTLAVFVNDESDDFADTRAFLDRRIENVMHSKNDETA